MATSTDVTDFLTEHKNEGPSSDNRKIQEELQHVLTTLCCEIKNILCVYVIFVLIYNKSYNIKAFF